ncbi:MAG: site-2 protease family protein [Candidatus Omnitrophica bacterium]|nr:site-2 protease family protein [Candidatus Omnitrophota bacterium]
MKNSLRIARFFGIDIELHLTFLVLLVFFLSVMGIKGILLVAGVFICVTTHELSHSLAARYFGMRVRKITLLPIGGIASVSGYPRTPRAEMLISFAGPLSNILIMAVFYFPLYFYLGADKFFSTLNIIRGSSEIAGIKDLIMYVYWLNMVIAVFNLMPAFPMDGGRILRAWLSYRCGREKATKIAVRTGHIFALCFAYLGIVYGHIFLLIIAVFVYTSATGEEESVSVEEYLVRFRVGDVISRKAVCLSPEMTLSDLYGQVLSSDQEIYPVLSEGGFKGIFMKDDIFKSYRGDKAAIKVRDIMTCDPMTVKAEDRLDTARKLMIETKSGALTVLNEGSVTGIVTMNDIMRAYLMAKELGEGKGL